MGAYIDPTHCIRNAHYSRRMRNNPNLLASVFSVYCVLYTFIPVFGDREHFIAKRDSVQVVLDSLFDVQEIQLIICVIHALLL